MSDSRQFVVVVGEDLPANHPLVEEGASPSGPLVLEQYLGEQASLDSISSRSNKMSARGFRGVQVWRVMSPIQVRSFARKAFLLGLGVGVFVSLAILSLVPSP